MSFVRAFFLVSCLFLASCEKTVLNRGYIMESADFSKIVVGKDDARAVFKAFGSPTMRSTLKDDMENYSWYYVSKRAEKTGPLDPSIVDQKTMVVTFDKNNVVLSVKDATHEHDIQTVSETTQTEGKSKGLIGETFGGMGKYLKRYTKK